MRRVDFASILNKSSNILPKIIAGLLAVITVVGLGVAILTAYFGTPMGDDYLAIKTYSNKHTWLAESWHSLTNTGRYMQSITSSAAYGLLRDSVGILLPLIVMAWLYALIVLYIKLANQKFKLSIPNASILIIAAPILFVFMNAGRPDSVHHLWFTYQAFYFSSAIVTYTIGVLLYLSFLYYALVSKWFRAKSLLAQSIAVFIVTYILGLYNETTPATVFGISLLALLLINLTPIVKSGLQKRYNALLSSAAIASLLSLLTMYFSPSNIARRQSLNSMGSDKSHLIESILANFKTVISSLMLRPSDIALIFLIGITFYLLVLGKQSRSNLKPVSLSLTGAGVIMTGLLTLLGTLVLLGLGYGATPNVYPRTLLIPQLVINSGLIILAVGLVSWLYSYHKAKSIQVAVLVIFTIGAFIITPHHIARSAGHITGAQDYNAIWQNQDSQLKDLSRSNPEETVYIKDEGAGIGDGFSTKCTGPYAKSTIWLADGMEAYYGLREICAQSDLNGKTNE